ncbi:MAG: hypothetical protein FJ344_01710 [Sphingomonadales bacterium]|nr:hypothetical protein [Sphingomonadales bacterium]
MTPPHDGPTAVAGDYTRPEVARLVARTLLSLLFLLSAWLKAVDYPSFEVHLLTQVGTGWMATPFLATLLIAIEFALGFYWLNIASANRWFEQATAWVLLFFSAYLGFLWSKQGNGVDCGCMGSALQMNPSEALARNLVAGAFLIIARGERALMPFKIHPTLLASLPLVLAAAATAYTTPPPWGTTPEMMHSRINDDPLFRWGFPYPESEPQIRANSEGNDMDYARQGLGITPKNGRLTTVMSVHCGYCALAADRIGKLSSELPTLNIQIILVGRPQELAPFIQEHKLQSTRIYHPPKVIVQPFVPYGVPEIWFTAADGRKWKLSLRQITPRNVQSLMEEPSTPKN